LLAMAMAWVGRYDPPQIDQNDIPVLENYDVISSFEPLTELSQAEPGDNADQQSQDM
jgi:hypothetical protein